MVANHKEEEGFWGACSLEELQVDVEHGLEEAVVGTIVATHIVLKHVDNQHLGDSQREDSTLALHFLQLLVNKKLRRKREKEDVSNKELRNRRLRGKVKTWFSPRSLPSVPSTSMIRVLLGVPTESQSPGKGHTQEANEIRDEKKEKKTTTKKKNEKERKKKPLVVCCLLASCITSKLVWKSMLSNVPTITMTAAAAQTQQKRERE